MVRNKKIALAKGLVFVAALVPLGVLVWRAFAGTLRPDPVERLTHTTGLTGLILLFVTLSLTPLRRLTGWNVLIRFRRMIGLFAFSYILIHFLIYIVFDHALSLASIAEDVIERPYVTVGFAGFVLLIPLAVTSTTGWVRRLGGRRWAMLHRLIYPIAILGVLHFLWQVKLDTTEPLWYAGILAVILGSRLVLRGR